jgi:hypothetical protein
MAMLEKLSVVEKVGEETTESIDNEYNSSDEENEPQKLEEDNSNSKVNIVASEPVVKKEEGIVQVEVKNEKNMTVNEIYSIYNIENSNVNTVFMLGNFINALPENLPYDVKKCSVLNIIEASNTDLNKLLSDGKKRLNALNKFGSDYYNSTSNTIGEYRTQIAKLKELINSYEEQIQLKENMLGEQNHIIKYETQKINSIISFFENGDK